MDDIVTNSLMEVLWELDYGIIVILSFNDSSLIVFILTINLHHFLSEIYVVWQLKRMTISHIVDYVKR